MNHGRNWWSFWQIGIELYRKLSMRNTNPPFRYSLPLLSSRGWLMEGLQNARRRADRPGEIARKGNGSKRMQDRKPTAMRSLLNYDIFLG